METNNIYDFLPRKPHRPPGGTKPPEGGGGGTGDNGGVEQRVANLETFAADAKERLTRVETKLDHIEREVGQVKWWIVAQIIAGVLAVLGTGVAIQQMTVATFEAAGKANVSSTVPPIIINVPPAAPATATAPVLPSKAE